MTRGSTRRVARRGNVAIITAICIVMLFGFAALAVDIGNMYRVRMQTRAALDAAALAGASGLNGKSTGLTLAVQRATTYAANHEVYGAPLSLTSQEVETGNWNFTTSTFTPNVSVDTTNAVRVTHVTPAVATPFAAIRGNTSSSVGANAVAVGGGPMLTQCGAPFMLADCMIRAATVGDACNYCMTMADATSDTAGFTVFWPEDTVNGPDISKELAAACTTGGADRTPAINADGTCAGQCANKASTTQKLKVNNGNLMNKSPGNFCPLIQNILERDGRGTAKPFKVTVPVMKVDGACNPAFRNEVTVAGFAEVTIFGARCTNGEPGVFAPNPTGVVCTPPPSGKTITAVLDCDSIINAPGGGLDFGLKARPRLVQ